MYDYIYMIIYVYVTVCVGIYNIQNGYITICNSMVHAPG